MKNIVSLIIFTAALTWSWNLIHSSPAVGIETHSGIQIQLAQLIKNTVLAKKPTAQNIDVYRLWTETLNNNKVKAHFGYKYNETAETGEVLEQSVEGVAILHREPPTEPGQDVWILQNVEATNDSVVFSEGSTISPNMTFEPEAPAATEGTAEANGTAEATTTEGTPATATPATETAAPTAPAQGQ